MWNVVKDHFYQSPEGSIYYTNLNEELTRDFEVTIMLHLLIKFLLTLSTWKGFFFKANRLVKPFLYRNFKTMWINQLNNFSRTQLHLCGI